MPTIEELEQMMDAGKHINILPNGDIEVDKEQNKLLKKLDALKKLINDEQLKENVEVWRLVFYDGFLSAIRIQQNNWNGDLTIIETEFQKFLDNRKEKPNDNQSSFLPKEKCHALS